MSLAGTLSSLTLCFAGLSGLCLAMDRHHQQGMGGRVSAARANILRLVGWALLTLSLIECIRDLGAGTGPVLWFGLLSLAAACIAIALPYAPRLLAPCAGFCAIAGVLVLAMH